MNMRDVLFVVLEWMAARERQFRRRLIQARVELNRIFANLLQDEGVTVHLPAGFRGLSVRHLQQLIRMHGPGHLPAHLREITLDNTTPV